jgi:hypothetical protein
MNRTLLRPSIYPNWLIPLASILVLASACLSVAALLGAQSPAPQPPATLQVPGVPNRPELVTVVPFFTKVNESKDEACRVVVSANVNRRRGVFVVDLGDPGLGLNRTYMQPTPDGGVDTITDTNRIPDNNTAKSTPVHVRLFKIGTVQIDGLKFSPPYSAHLDHEFNNYELFTPRLGQIGLSVLEPFETIVDYTHKRLVLIRLDSVGHRLVPVPAYTPKWSTPLLDLPIHQGKEAKEGKHWWGITVQPNYVLDTLDASKNTMPLIVDTGGCESDDEGLNYDFLSKFGAFGVNHRTHQFILYH